MDIYGIIGWPIGHSLSPAMHNAAFKKLGIDAEYKKFEVRPEGLEDFFLNRKDVKGFNVTIPHKIRAKEIIDRNNPLDVASADKYYVEISGAINTVKRDGDCLGYMNTDPIGFRHSLEQDLEFKHTKGKGVLLIGCGGAGRAIVAELSSSGNYIAKIYIYDVDGKTVDSAQKHFFSSRWRDALGRTIEFISGKDMRETIKKCHLLVNASPVGMKVGEDLSVVDKSILALNKELYVYDVVYNRETGLLKTAKSLGMRAVGGKGMLAAQGAFSFSFWTGVKPADVINVMREALDKALEDAK